MTKKFYPLNFIAGRNRSPAQSGYTLIELVVIIVVIGVLAAVATARMMNPASNIYSVADMIVSDLRELQGMAMTGGEEVRIKFNKKRYRAYQGNREIKNDRYPVDLSDYNARIGKARQITFNSYGEPGKHSIDPIIVQSGDGSMEVEVVVEMYTGFIHESGPK